MRVLNKGIWPYQIEVEKTNETYKTIAEWCSDVIGISGKEWYFYGVRENRTFIAFKDEEVFLMFKLRCGNLCLKN